jgi:hypothetical protein
MGVSFNTAKLENEMWIILRPRLAQLCASAGPKPAQLFRSAYCAAELPWLHVVLLTCRWFAPRQT